MQPQSQKSQTYFVMVKEDDGEWYTYEVYEAVRAQFARIIRVIGPAPTWASIPDREDFCTRVRVRLLRITRDQEERGEGTPLSCAEALQELPRLTVHVLIEDPDARVVRQVLAMRPRTEGEPDALPQPVPTLLPPDPELGSSPIPLTRPSARPQISGAFSIVPDGGDHLSTAVRAAAESRPFTPTTVEIPKPAKTPVIPPSHEAPSYIPGPQHAQTEPSPPPSGDSGEIPISRKPRRS